MSAVSHELRTPLTIVQGYLHRTIKRGDNLSPNQVKGLQTAEEESIRMRRLLDDLLDLSRGDSGRLAIAKEPVRLADQLEQVAELAHHVIFGMKTNTPFPIQMHGYGTQMGLTDTETTLTTKKKCPG